MLKLGKRITDEERTGVWESLKREKKVLNLSHLTDEQHEMGVRNWRKGKRKNTKKRQKGEKWTLKNGLESKIKYSQNLLLWNFFQPSKTDELMNFAIYEYNRKIFNFFLHWYFLNFNVLRNFSCIVITYWSLQFFKYDEINMWVHWEKSVC